MQLRDYQQNGKNLVYQQWNEHGRQNVILVMSTGAGKTVTFTSIIKEHVGTSIAIAHRQELVGQISIALARYGVRHKIIGPEKVIKQIIAEQINELGESYYHPNAQCAVAGVDTLIRRADKLRPFLNQVTLWVQDECHHELRENK